MTYNWQQDDWPEFSYQLLGLEKELFLFAEKTGQINGMVTAMPETMQQDTMLDLMVTEAIKTSEIEGEYISRQDVISSIRNKIDINGKPEHIKDKKAKGAAELMLAVRNSYKNPLNEAALFEWHQTLLGDAPNIAVGAWRTHTEPMQVVSGMDHKPNIHFEAPPSSLVPKEMGRYIDWFNCTELGKSKEIKHAIIRSAIAHLYFESIHPFEDGNGRIGRSLSEKALSQGIRRPILLSLSKAIEANKKAYYDELERAQRSNEITPWITYFVNMILQAQQNTESLVDFILKKARFFDAHKDKLDDIHIKALNRMLQEGPKGFKGGMSAKKYIAITAVSKATATRHLQYLAGIGALIPIGSGRSTHYEINLP